MESAAAHRQALLRAVSRLALDATAADIVEALRARQVRSILLKGPVIARWLYAERSERGYGDIDLLVSPHDVGAAQSVLARLGFTDALAGTRADERPVHAGCWRRGRPAPAVVDLHTSLYWTRVEPDEVWALLSRHTEPLTLAGCSLDVLDIPARALLISLHACQHGRHEDQPLEDLTRAVAQVHEPSWVQAAELAQQLGASAPFAAGLRLVTGGAELAARLGLSGRVAAEVHLRAATPLPTAWGFLRLAEAQSTRERVRLIARELAPTPAFMRGWQPLARHGRAGLVAAYAWRPFWLAWKLPRGAAAWTQARRGADLTGESSRPGRRRFRIAARRMTALRPATVRGALWGWRACARARTDLRTGGLDGVRLSSAPRTGPRGERGVMIALRLRRASCLESALVRKAMYAARGDRRRLIIGVSTPSPEFAAHAWLEGDPDDGGERFTELLRR